MNLQYHGFNSKTLVTKLCFYFLIFIFLFGVLFPFYWMIVTSFKGYGELYLFPPTFFPRAPTFGNYVAILGEKLFLGSYLNSIIVVFTSSLISLLVSIFAAYSLARFRYRGAAFISSLLLFSYLVPRPMLVIPLYIIIGKLGLMDTLSSLVLTYITTAIPFSVWILTGYFRSIPRELDEVAAIDGCGRITILFKIILPLAAPGIVAVMIFNLVNGWNIYLYPLIFTSSASKRLLPIAINELMLGDVFKWGRIMSMTTSATLPFVALFILVRKHIVRGLGAGAVKG